MVQLDDVIGWSRVVHLGGQNCALNARMFQRIEQLLNTNVWRFLILRLIVLEGLHDSFEPWIVYPFDPVRPGLDIGVSTYPGAV